MNTIPIHNLKQKHFSKRGFTLIEVMIVVVLTTVLALFVMPFVNDFQGSNALVDQEQQVLLSLRFAQSRSQVKEGNSRWGVYFPSAPSRAFYVYRGDSYPTRMPAYDEEHTFPASITISGSQDINFNQLGIPQSAATVVLSSSTNKQKTIEVSPTGRIDTVSR
ncbi:MAG: type II secretion system protein [bacterium]